MVEIETDIGPVLINPINVTQVFGTNNGRVRINLIDQSYAVTSSSYEEVRAMLMDAYHDA